MCQLSGYSLYLTVRYRFRWVFCQLDALQHSFPPNIRQYLNELPDSLDDTYDRILKGINKAQRDNAHRLLQCLTVAVRPLLVEELAELLAFDFQVSTKGGIPTLNGDWRWDDEEEAVLSICSSLITIIPRGNSQVVQFSHFSVKEYLTSSRLAQSPHTDISRFRIDLEPAHTIMTQSCLATLLRLDEHNHVKVSPLVQYAAEHWVNHAQFEKVSLRLRDGMDDLFDSSKPHFAAWLRVHDIDKWRDVFFSPYSRRSLGSPLYYAAICGFYGVVERLITTHPKHVTACGGWNLFPLPAALYNGHLHVADLLYRHGAVVNVQGYDKRTPLYAAASHGQVDIIQWLLNHGADVDACSHDGYTPLIEAACTMQLEAVQLLFDHHANINSQDRVGRTSLHWLLVLAYRGSDEKLVDMVRLLLKFGADPNICDNHHRTPLHEASSQGLLEAARLLLSYGAKVDGKDGIENTPFQLASSNGHDELTKLLVEHGAVPPSQ